MKMNVIKAEVNNKYILASEINTLFLALFNYFSIKIKPI